MDKILEMIVSTPEQFLTAIRLSQNVLEKLTVINVVNHEKGFCNESILTFEIGSGVTSLYKNTAGSFAGAQLSHFSACWNNEQPGRILKMRINACYSCSPQELNDLICVSAEIACLLNKQLKNSSGDLEKIHAFDQWVKRTFEYKNTCQIEDYPAIELLKDRIGVCQAIAAIAVLVLSYMGVKVLYVAGEGNGSGGWEPHAWNTVFVYGKWIHVDFALSMDSVRLPSTKSWIEERFFVKTHRWDKNEYSSHSMDFKWKYTGWDIRDKIIVNVNADSCLINGVEVIFPSKVIVKDGNEILVDFGSIISLLGGGIELIPDTGTINICVYNKKIIIKDVKDIPKYIYDGFFDLNLINHLWKTTYPYDSVLRIEL